MKLQQRYTHVYRWLSTYDNVWFMQNLPPPKRKQVNVEEYRAAWLEMLQQYALAGNGPLSEQLPHVYTWLLRRDREWLRSHTPVRLPREYGPRVPEMDSERDETLALRVREAADRLRNVPGYPQRIHRLAIIKIIDIPAETRILRTIHSRKDRFPMTCQALDDVVETYSEYAIRRVQWATECYRCEGVHPTSHQLRSRAKVEQWSYLGNAQVMAAVEEALASLQV
jgi:hypothetical protein